MAIPIRETDSSISQRVNENPRNSSRYTYILECRVEYLTPRYGTFISFDSMTCALDRNWRTSA